MDLIIGQTGCAVALEKQTLLHCGHQIACWSSEDNLKARSPPAVRFWDPLPALAIPHAEGSVRWCCVIGVIVLMHLFKLQTESFPCRGT